ncbi:MAG: hypothetical protein ACI82G_000662 [Bradymonadia bacterium]|jgi:hypothetical protein
MIERLLSTPIVADATRHGSHARGDRSEAFARELNRVVHQYGEHAPDTGREGAAQPRHEGDAFAPPDSPTHPADEEQRVRSDAMDDLPSPWLSAVPVSQGEVLTTGPLGAHSKGSQLTNDQALANTDTRGAQGYQAPGKGARAAAVKASLSEVGQREQSAAAPAANGASSAKPGAKETGGAVSAARQSGPLSLTPPLASESAMRPEGEVAAIHRARAELGAQAAGLTKTPDDGAVLVASAVVGPTKPLAQSRRQANGSRRVELVTSESADQSRSRAMASKASKQRATDPETQQLVGEDKRGLALAVASALASGPRVLMNEPRGPSLNDSRPSGVSHGMLQAAPGAEMAASASGVRHVAPVLKASEVSNWLPKARVFVQEGGGVASFDVEVISGKRATLEVHVKDGVLNARLILDPGDNPTLARRLLDEVRAIASGAGLDAGEFAFEHGERRQPAEEALSGAELSDSASAAPATQSIQTVASTGLINIIV